MRSRNGTGQVLLTLVLVSILPACSYHRVLGAQDIEVDDNDRLMPSGRIAYEILPGIETRRRGSMLDLVMGRSSIVGERADGESVPRATFTLGVAGELSSVDGRDEIFVPDSFERLELGAEIPGPATVDAEIQRLRAHVNVRAGGRFFDILSIEGTLGLGVDDAEVKLRSPGTSLTEEKTKAAFAWGARIGLRPIPLLDLYGQFVLMVGEFSSFDAEAGGQLNLTPNLGVYAAYRRTTYSARNFRGHGSDVEDGFSGPTFGASLSF